MADYIRRVLTGDVNNLPQKESNIIRIFTSSTFTDTTEERNRLMRDVYPSLRTYCQQHGLEFQVVDMRWGVRDEATADHKTSELCLQEIKNCQRLTAGPNFVCFLGNKYGYRPFPYKIDAVVFENLVEIAREAYDDPTHIELMLEWYWKDTNAIPVEYVLKPVTDRFPHYNDLSDENKEQNKRERQEWWQIFDALQKLLKKMAKIARDRNLISEQEAHKYISSVTEEEIEQGILDAPDPGAQSLCYMRHISDIEVNLTDKNSRLYTDLSQGRRDNEAQELLDHLKRERILRKLGESNVTHYEIPWSSGGINVSDRVHEEYLNTFCNKFQSDVLRLIDKSLQSVATAKAQESKLYKEVLHHAWFCQDKCTAFRGRQNVLHRVKAFLTNFQALKPLVIFGSSGSGKTSIMAMVVRSVKDWLGHKAVSVFRFLGTSPDSSSIRSTIASTCFQISEVFNIAPPNTDIMEDFTQLVRYFHSSLADLPVDETKPLVLIFDSVDQLSASNNAYLMNWLPKHSPQFVKIIISVLPVYGDILPNLRRSLLDENSYIEVPTLTLDTGQEILQAWLQGQGRTLTDEQFDLVLSNFTQCPQPLFLKLIFTEASKWHSYTNAREQELGDDVRKAIGFLFRRLERKHGKMLTSRALSYITAARNGLTENELEDILSLDDDVIDDVYQYWDPPVEGVVRLPNLLWARIRHDINEFLVERQADGKTVVAWYHRQFWETAREQYLSDPQEKQARHSLLSEYFEGVWGEGRKKHITLTRRKKTLPKADRQVSSQPLLFAKSVFNLRKLSEMPYHLVHSGRTDTLYSEVLFNFEWIYGKVRGQSLNEVLVDYSIALDVQPRLDVRLIYDTLVLATSNIDHDVDCLAPQLIGRLLAFKTQFPQIGSLVDQCYRWCYEQQTPLFIPQSACLISAGGPLRTNLRGHFQRVNEIAVTRDNRFIVTTGEDSLVNVWNISNFDCLHTLKMSENGASCLALTRDDRYAIASAKTGVGVWDIDTGEVIQQFNNGGVVKCLTAAPDGIHVAIGGSDGVVHVWQILTAQKKQALIGHEGPINAIVVSNNGNIISGSQDSTVRVWSLVEDKCQALFKGHVKAVLCLVLTRDGESVVSGSEDKTIRVWHLKTQNCATLKGHGGLVKCLDAMHDGRRIVSGSKDQQIRIWDLVTLQCCMTMIGHTDLIWRLAVASDDSFIVSASKDDMLKVWNPETGECKQTLIGHSSWISCVALTEDGKTIISGSNDKNIKLWNAEGNEHAQSIETQSDHIIHHVTQPECVAITTDGRWGLSGSKNDSLKLWEMRSAKCVKSSKHSVACIATMQSLAQGSQAVTGSHSGEITVWDCESLTPRQTIKVHSDGVTSLQFSTDDTFIVSASADKRVGLCYVSGGRMQHLAGHSDAVLCISLMTGDDQVVSGSKDTTVRVWNLLSMSCERVLEGHKGAVGCVTSTKDNRIIVSGSGDFNIKVWSLEKGECIHTLEGHHDSIKCLGITCDNHFVIAGSHEAKEQLRLWNINTGSCARTFKGHTHAVMNLKVLPYDNMAVTSSRDGTIKVWNILNGELISSFDFQSQVKYFDIKATEDEGYSVILVTKSGTVSVLRLYLPRNTSVDPVKIQEPVSRVKDVASFAQTTPTEEGQQYCCPSCRRSRCCLQCQTCLRCILV